MNRDQPTACSCETVDATLERTRAVMNRFGSRSIFYVDFFSTPSELEKFFDANLSVFDVSNNEELASNWTDCILTFFERWGSSVLNQNRRVWPFEEGFFYRHFFLQA